MTGKEGRKWFQRAVAWARSARRLARGLDLRSLTPAILPLAAAPFLLASLRCELNEPLFSDPLVFQYAGWCIRHGLRLYRDIGMADGPFIYYLHAAIQVVAGIGDRAFRRSDVLLQLAGGGLMGAAVAPPFQSVFPADATTSSRLPRTAWWIDRSVWAAVGAATWIAWYFTFGWDATCQRDAFYGLFGSTGLALIYSGGRGSLRRARVCLIVGAVLVTSQAFGKPTGVMYPAAGLLSVLLPDADSPLDLRGRLHAFLTGCGACVAAVLLLLLVSGSVTGYFHWCWRIPYVGNRFLYRENWLKFVLTPYWERFEPVVVVALVGGIASIGVGLVPLRALGIVVVPPIAFLGACLQARGYDYHVMPSIGASHLVLLVVLASLWTREPSGFAPGRSGLAAAGLIFATVHTFDDLHDTAFRWKGTDESWTKPEHTHHDLEKDVGRYLGAHTRPDDWVFSYDGDAHIVLLYAERRTASAYLHPYFVDPVGILPQSGIQPNPSELAALKSLQVDNRAAACAGVMRHAPAALVLRSVESAIAICPPLKQMMDDDFELANTMAPFSIYLRKAAVRPP